MTNSNLSIAKSIKEKKVTLLSSYIEKRLIERGNSWSQLVVYCGWPKPYITRLRSKGWIPEPRGCTNIAGFLAVPWYEVWVKAGHIREEDLKDVAQSYVTYEWYLTGTEAELIGSYRYAMPESREAIQASARGAARATENAYAQLKRQQKIKLILEMDFVNQPEWIEEAGLNTVTIPGYGEAYVINQAAGFGYLHQSCTVGTLRHAITGKMSPIPKKLFTTET